MSYKSRLHALDNADSKKTQDPSRPTIHPPALSILTEFSPQPQKWLWPGRIPLGALTLLDAAPGCGTSLFALTLAACISSGAPLPAGTPCPKAPVLLIAPHDSPSRTIAPRLLAAGADPSQILLLSDSPVPSNPPLSEPPRRRPFILPDDLDYLRTIITAIKPALVILDPLVAIPGHRQHLLTLALLAEQTGCAILLARSLPQLPPDPLRPGLLPPFLAPVHSRLLLMPHPNDERQALLLTVKHSLCPPPDTLTYQVHANDQGVPVIDWLPPCPDSLLSRLPTTPLLSPQRQAILRFLHASPTPHTLTEILTATSYDQAAGRKMIWRMKQAGDIIYIPTGHYYTTPGHPCLAQISSEQIPVPPVPPVPDVLSQALHRAISSLREQTPVPPVPGVGSSTI